MGLDPARCLQRNRIAARRDGIDAAPVQILQGAPAETLGTRLSWDGELPESREAEMAAINALLPSNQEPLTAAQVYVHYVEAANGNFIPDRFMFLDRSTLRNIAQDARRGVSFMNSHRTGGLSHPSELPFGKTFAGRYEEFLGTDGRTRQRTLMAFYMLRGVHPNGAGGPSTDEMNRMIEGGTLSDVSIGLTRDGQRLCDVCGNELGKYDEETGDPLCSHAPGSRRGMSPEDRAGQEERGVPGGVASYSLHNGRLGELSGVFDGAVPGAGFRHALALSRTGDWSGEELSQVRAAYGNLAAKGDFQMGDQIEGAIERGFARIAEALGLKRGHETAAEQKTGDEGGRDQARFAEMEAALAAEREARQKLEAEHAAAWSAGVAREALAFADAQVRAGRCLPAERPALVALFCAAADDDRHRPLTVTFGEGKEGGRLDALKASYEARQPHDLLRELVKVPAEGLVALSSDAGQGPNAPMSEERRAQLLGMSSAGQAILREKNGR